MYDKILNDSHIYTDVQGLQQLQYQYKTNPKAVTKEVAQQFESMLVQMMLNSMRSANQAFKSDLLSNNQMEFYEDMFDKQLSLVISSHGGLGFAESIERNMKRHGLPDSTEIVSENTVVAKPFTSHERVIGQKYDLDKEHRHPSPKKYIDDEAATDEVVFDSQESFIRNLWPLAKMAANLIGANPKILIAQAALETNWGKKILPFDGKTSSFNLFNIKADGNWPRKTALVDSLEQKNGILVKEKSTFRSYESFMDSFMDYVHFLKQNSRYSEALTKAADPKQFVTALQQAGYATDSNYADKILKIFSSRALQHIYW